MLCEILVVTERLPLLLCLERFRPERDAPSGSLENRPRAIFLTGTRRLSFSRSLDRASSDLAAQLLGTDTLPDSLSSLLERAAGTPLWLEELVHTLRERGIVNGSDQVGSTSARIDELEIPDSLHGLIVARLDRLGEARVALQTASVIGRQFSHRVLARISAGEALDEHLVQAQRADLVRQLAAIPRA